MPRLWPAFDREEEREQLPGSALLTSLDRSLSWAAPACLPLPPGSFQKTNHRVNEGEDLALP